MFRSIASKSVSSLKTVSATRSFHSPFAVLGSQLTTPTPSPAAANAGWYDKQYDFSHEPVVSHNGQHTYVVSQPDPAHTPYEVPSGAYPTSAPYISYTPTEAPETNGLQFSSTGNGFAHPVTTKAATKDAAVRFTGSKSA